MIRTLALTIGLLVLASSAIAEEPRGVDGIEQVFVRWMKEHNVKRGSVAVAYGDRLVLAKGYGGLTAESRVLIASLSKAITGVCVTTLIQDGKLRLDTPIGEVLDRAKKRLPTARDARLPTATIEQLLTHRAGFGRAAGDPATGATLREILAQRPVSHVTMHDLVPGVLRAKLEHDPGTTYAYTNGPHLLLGVAIEAITGERYEDYCGATVLRPQGIQRPTLHDRWGVLGSFGGWSLSGAEYLAFLRGFGPSATVLSRETRAWMVAPGGKEIGTGTQFYSLLLVRPVNNGGHNFSHSGSWGYRLSPTSASGAINDSIGTRAMRTASGASWFVSFEPRPDAAARDVLDRELLRAADAVKAWPDTDLYPALGLR